MDSRTIVKKIKIYMIYLNKVLVFVWFLCLVLSQKIFDLASKNKNLIFFFYIIVSVMSRSRQGISTNLFTAIFVVGSRVT
jgi:hypothetical protein